jgi:hypothetical protein
MSHKDDIMDLRINSYIRFPDSRPISDYIAASMLADFGFALNFSVLNYTELRHEPNIRLFGSFLGAEHQNGPRAAVCHKTLLNLTKGTWISRFQEHNWISILADTTLAQKTEEREWMDEKTRWSEWSSKNGQIRFAVKLAGQTWSDCQLAKSTNAGLACGIGQ